MTDDAENPALVDWSKSHADCCSCVSDLRQQLTDLEKHDAEITEALEVWSAEICQHGPGGTHASLAELSRCLLSELARLRRAVKTLTEPW